MGVKGLYSYLRPYRTDLYAHTLQALYPKPLRIGFDGLSMLYKYKSAYRDMESLLRTLKEQGHRILFVFDGKAPAEKAEEIATRREARASATTQADGLRSFVGSSSFQAMDQRSRELVEYSLARLEHQGWQVTREIRKDFQDLLKGLGVPYVKATSEADDVLVDLCAAGKLDVVVSGDMDYLLAGAPRLWIPSRKGVDGFEELVLAEVLAGEDLALTAFRDAGILCGVDELKGQVSVQPQAAMAWLRQYGGTLEGVLARGLPQLEGAEAALTEETVARVRGHYTGQSPWSNRIRSEDVDATREFLEAL